MASEARTRRRNHRPALRTLSLFRDTWQDRLFVRCPNAEQRVITGEPGGDSTAAARAAPALLAIYYLPGVGVSRSTTCDIAGERRRAFVDTLIQRQRCTEDEEDDEGEDDDVVCRCCRPGCGKVSTCLRLQGKM